VKHRRDVVEFPLFREKPQVGPGDGPDFVRSGAAAWGEGVGDHGFQDVDAQAVQCPVDVQLAFVIEVERRGAQAGVVGDHLDGGAAVPMEGEELLRRVPQFFHPQRFF